jgi:inorganic triphosphatase YgiF
LVAEKSLTELELKFLVPPAARADFAAEMARGSSAPRRMSLAAMYLDTEDHRLAQAGLAWRLRREGRRWIQTLKTGGPTALERFEHEVARPAARYDASQHAGTPDGDRLIAILKRAHADGMAIGVRFQTEVRRTTRRVRTQGATVEIAFDEGRLLADGSSQRIREVEFELCSGSAAAMLALAERWRKRFGLIYEPRSKSERGDRLAQGNPYPAVRKAEQPRYADEASAAQALAAVVQECLAHITGNAIGLVDGDPVLGSDHVHQVRVGIRRLRSALRSFEDWARPPPADLVDGLRSLFATLGRARDSDVLTSGVVAELAKVGAPALAVLPAGAAGADPVEAIKAAGTQRVFLAWISWQSELSLVTVETADPPAKDMQAADEGMVGKVSPADTPPSTTPGPEATKQASSSAPQGALEFHRRIDRRLRQWHRRILTDWTTFDELDEARLHALRKRIKRQRYAVEFFAPVLRRRKAKRYLNALAVIQDLMGELNDLFVARAKYQSLVESHPAAWFALGWLAARISQTRARAKPALARLAKVDPPTT